MSGPDFIDLPTPSLPPWLAEAVDAIKIAADVPHLLGRDVEELRRTVCAFIRRPLREDEPLPEIVFERLKDCIAYNDMLAKRRDKTTGEYLNRQSVASLVGNGKWRDAPKRRMEKASKDDTFTPNPEKDEQERLAYQQRVDDELWMRAFHAMLESQCASTVEQHRDAARERFKDRVLRAGGTMAAVMGKVEAATKTPTLNDLAALVDGL